VELGKQDPFEIGAKPCTEDICEFTTLSWYPFIAYPLSGRGPETVIPGAKSTVFHAAEACFANP